MNIFMTGSQSLSEFDKEEIKNYLSNFAERHTIHIMCYRSLEVEVLKFFVENEHLAERLFIYTFQPLHLLPQVMRETILLLKEAGAKYQDYGFQEIRMKRSYYEEVWKNLIKNRADLVMCFYNRDKATAVIPLDLAKECKVDAMMYELPGNDEKKFKRSLEAKVRVV